MKKAFALIELLVVITILAIIVGLIVNFASIPRTCPPTYEGIAVRALENDGYKDITVMNSKPREFLSRVWKFKCIAINPLGKQVEIHVYINPERPYIEEQSNPPHPF